MSPLIPPDQHFTVFAVILLIALIGFWVERQRWGQCLPAAIWSILLAIVAANIKLIPHQAAVYDIVFQYFVPLLLPLFLMQANIKRILTETGRVGIAFLFATIGTIAGAVIASNVIHLGDYHTTLTGMFVSTYTGGSANFAAVAQSSGFNDSDLLSAATAADNLLGVFFLILVSFLPASNWLMTKYALHQHDETPLENLKSQQAQISLFSITGALTYAFLVVALADLVVYALNHLNETLFFSKLRYLFITLLSIIPATLYPRPMNKMHGGQMIGVLFASLFFIAIAAGASVEKMLTYAPIMMVFVTILLITHATIVFFGGYLFSIFCRRWGYHKLALSLPELIIASNAAIFGATTAPALAASKGWGQLITPGILVGVAGYIIGTPLGLLFAGR